MDSVLHQLEEAEAQDRYVMAHAYTAKAVDRALDCGVRSIEHGNMIDEATAAKIVEKRAFLVPTVTVFWAMNKEGPSIGLPAVYQDKVNAVHDAAMRGLETAHRKGVKMVYGTDLFGPMHAHQAREFSIRAEIQKPIDAIRAATLNAAELFQRAGEIGEIVPGARADLLVVEGDPLRDLNLLQDQGRHLAAIMKDGRFHVRRF